MGTLPPALASAAFLVAASVYVLPTVVAVHRRAAARTEACVLNLLLGWTGAAWACALILACRPRRPDGPPPPIPPRPAPHPPATTRSVYREGVYLVSRGLDSNTWAIHENGLWRLAYEVAGTDRLVSFVDEEDIPLNVLAQALDPSGR